MPGGSGSRWAIIANTVVLLSATVLGLLPGASAGQQLPASPAVVASWPLTEPSGPVVHDHLGQHDGIAVGDVRFGQVGQGPTVTSAVFTGAGSGVTVPGPDLSAAVASFTVWFRTPRQPAGSFGSVIDTGRLTADVTDGRVVVGTCPSAVHCRAETLQTPSVTDGAWHQLAASLDGARITAELDGMPARAAPTTASGVAGQPAMITIGVGFVGDINDVTVYRGPLPVRTVRAQFIAGACPQLSTPVRTLNTVRTPPALPLHTDGRFVLDSHHRRLKLAGVNWYGAEELDQVPAGLQCQSVDTIASRIAAAGYNIVRLPWATDTWDGRSDPAVPPVAVAANPQLRGRGARAVFDAVINALARHGLLVMLDNHVTRPDWCCDGNDGNGLWWQGYDPTNPPAWHQMSTAAKRALFTVGQDRWLAGWTRIIARYSAAGSDPQPSVVAADLRNEPRSDGRLGVTVAWAGTRLAPWSDWPGAATLAGNAILRINPAMLIAVEGVNYATDLRGVVTRPITLTVPRRLIYSVHDYAFTHGAVSASELQHDLGTWWGWLLTQHQRYTTPVWVGEFGTCHPQQSACTTTDTAWFSAFRSYLSAGDIDWIYFSVNGTGARGSAEPTTCDETPRLAGCADDYGIFDSTWTGDAAPTLTAALRALQPQKQR